jgi:hypothetical protein
VSANAHRDVPGWMIGLGAATAALVAIGYVSVGFFVSVGGLAIAAAVALTVGIGVAATVEPNRAVANGAVVTFYVLVLAVAYFLILPALAGPAPPGARGGPGVYPPGVNPPAQPRGSPGVYPP